MYLVDANVLSEATRPKPEPAVLAWLLAHEADLTVNAIVLGEIEYGIRILPAGRKRTRLLKWFTEGVGRLRVVEIDAGTASAWANLLSQLKRRGRAMSVKDSLIAASALQHQLVVVTSNIADFRECGVNVLNPFTS